MPVLERCPNVLNKCNICNICIQYSPYYLLKSIAQWYCTTVLQIILDTIVLNMIEFYCSAFYCTLLLATNLTNPAAAILVFCLRAAACLLAIAVLFTRQLSILFLSDSAFNSTSARIYCAPQAEGPPPLLWDPDSRRSPSSTERTVDA